MVAKKSEKSYSEYKESIKKKTDRKLMEDIALSLKKLEIKVNELCDSKEDSKRNILKTPKHVREKLSYPTRLNLEETWNKKRQEFEEIAEEISRDNDFFVLQDNALREKWVKKNYPKQKDVKALIKRALELYNSRMRVVYY